MNASLFTLWLSNLGIGLTLNHFFLNRPEISVKGGLSANFELKGIFFGKEETSFGLFWICFSMLGHFLQELFDFVALAFALVIIETLNGNVVVSGVKEVIDLVIFITVVRFL